MLTAPPHLTPEQAAIWAEVTSEGGPVCEAPAAVLEAYCVAASRRRTIERLLDGRPIPRGQARLLRFARLLTLERETAMLIKSLATSMGITPQRRFTPGRAATLDRRASELARPWGLL